MYFMIYVMNKYDMNQYSLLSRSKLGRHFAVEEEGDIEKEVDHSQHHLNTPRNLNVSVLINVCNVLNDVM